MSRTDLEVRIEPFEPMLFGDNRSARTGEGHVAGDQDPSPSTLFGAIGGQIARRLGAHGQHDWNDAARQVLGEFQPRLERRPAERDGAILCGYTACDAQGRPWFPRPLHLQAGRLEGGRYTFALLRPAREEERAGVLSSLPEEWSPLAETGDALPVDEEEAPLRIGKDLLTEVLQGPWEISSGYDGSVRRDDELFQPEARLGLALSNERNAAIEGRLFARPYRRYRSDTDREAGWRSAGFVAWYRVLDLAGREAAVWDGVGFLGGDRRRALFRFAPVGEDGPLAELRNEVEGAVAETCGFFVYLLTPAPLPKGGLELGGRKPVAGAVGRALHVSGWNAAASAHGPRPLLTLAPPGSVFFFKWRDEESDDQRRQWIRDCWLAPLDPAYGPAGFGRMLLGVWR